MQLPRAVIPSAHPLCLTGWPSSSCVQRTLCDHLLIPEDTLSHVQEYSPGGTLSKYEVWWCSRDCLIIQLSSSFSVHNLWVYIQSKRLTSQSKSNPTFIAHHRPPYLVSPCLWHFVGKETEPKMVRFFVQGQISHKGIHFFFSLAFHYWCYKTLFMFSEEGHFWGSWGRVSHLKKDVILARR